MPPRAQTGLPLVIHARQADDDIAAILREETGKGAFPFILHCFSSGRDLAMTGVELGGYVSFSGILTFKNSQDIRDIARDVPHDRLLVETDAPYLAPPPYRGKRNEPSYVVETPPRSWRKRSASARPSIAAITTDQFLSSFQQDAEAGGTGRVERGSDRLRLTMLGCGSSPGTPRITGDWGNCDPTNPKNRRMRPSAMVERIAENGGVTRVVIDTGPDFREQMLMARVQRLDAVVYTHPHADHIHGIDDLRGFVLEQRKLIDIHADAPTLARLKQAFGYCFETPPGSSYPPILVAHRIDHRRNVVIEGEGGALTFEPLPQIHGDIISLGFRIGPSGLLPRRQRFSADDGRAAEGPRSAGHRRAAIPARIRAISRSAKRLHGSSVSRRGKPF